MTVLLSCTRSLHTGGADGAVAVVQHCCSACHYSITYSDRSSLQPVSCCALLWTTSGGTAGTVPAVIKNHRDSSTSKIQQCGHTSFSSASFVAGVHRWGKPEFGAYVQQLQQQADEALAQSPAQMDAAKAIVKQIVQLELDFWSMAYAGSSTAQ